MTTQEIYTILKTLHPQTLCYIHMHTKSTKAVYFHPCHLIQQPISNKSNTWFVSDFFSDPDEDFFVIKGDNIKSLTVFDPSSMIPKISIKSNSTSYR